MAAVKATVRALKGKRPVLAGKSVVSHKPFAPNVANSSSQPEERHSVDSNYIILFSHLFV